MTTLIAAGYIAQDNEGYAIAGIGETEAAAKADALPWVGPWEDRDGNTVGADHPEFGFDANFAIYPATQALLDMVREDGGAISWDVVDGVACTRAEAAGDDE